MLSLDAIGGDPRNNGTNAMINRIPNPIADLVHQLATSDASTPSETSILDELDLTSGEGVRDAMHRLVALDLLGRPSDPKKNCSAMPCGICGWRACPQDAEPNDLALDDVLEGGGEAGHGEGSADANVASSSTLFSSSIGMTFVVAAGVDEIELEASWGSYDRRPSELHFTDSGSPKMVWRRQPRGGTLPL